PGAAQRERLVRDAGDEAPRRIVLLDLVEDRPVLADLAKALPAGGIPEHFDPNEAAPPGRSLRDVAQQTVDLAGPAPHPRRPGGCVTTGERSAEGGREGHEREGHGDGKQDPFHGRLPWSHISSREPRARSESPCTAHRRSSFESRASTAASRRASRTDAAARA